jgi:tetratricopeptide (TPR) repeat protein
MVTLAVLLMQLATSGFATGRPAECSGSGGSGGVNGRASNLWERAKAPELGRYCDLVASASSKLAGTRAMAEAALVAARDADRTLPGHAAPLALEGRALALLGRLDEAVVALREAAARDRRTLDDPATLLAWARALARTGHIEEASKAYHGLLPRAAVLPSAERASAAIEAGLVAMASGPGGLDDAAAALRAAMREAQDDLAPLAILALALALDRRGDVDEARALLAEHLSPEPHAVVDAPRARELLAATPNERAALVARGLQDDDPAGARDAWREFLAASGDGPWAAHARSRLAALGQDPGQVGHGRRAPSR